MFLIGAKFNKAVSFLYIMIKEQGKKAQMQISFGMIFSIILIVVFLGFAFYAIKTFISTGNNAKAGIFLDKIEGDIEQILKSSVAVSSKPEEYLLPSFVDFVCFEKKLIIEIDGGQHNQSKLDIKRDEWLNSQGFNVIRFWNNEVLGNLDGVYQRIEESPVSYNAETKCHKVRERIWQEGQLVKDEVKEVCESERTEPTY